MHATTVSFSLSEIVRYAKADALSLCRPRCPLPLSALLAPAANRRLIEQQNKYCLRQSEMGIGDCAVGRYKLNPAVDP
jgi:hypothetical protein